LTQNGTTDERPVAARLSVDPRWGLTLSQLSDVLDHGSGLVGVSGRSSDVRELLVAEAGDDETAR
jgi:acetate kinase